MRRNLRKFFDSRFMFDVKELLLGVFLGFVFTSWYTIPLFWEKIFR